MDHRITTQRLLAAYRELLLGKLQKAGYNADHWTGNDVATIIRIRLKSDPANKNHYIRIETARTLFYPYAAQSPSPIISNSDPSYSQKVLEVAETLEK